MPRPARPGAHDALLDAAREEFARRGLENARVEDIARRAHVSKGAFYLHFRTKDDAFREILQRFLGAVEEQAARRHEAEERFLERTGSRGADFEERLEFECSCDVELLELMWRNRRIIVVIDGAGGHRFARMLRDFRDRMRAIVSRNIADAQACGQLRSNLDPVVLGDIIVGAYETYARRMGDMKEKPDLAGWIRTFLVVLYEGIADRPAQGAASDRRTAATAR